MQHALAVTPQDYYGTHVPTDIGRCVVMPIPVILDLTVCVDVIHVVLNS